ncbi:hypothetical protein [Streptosporangium saharense]|uniref:Uncharacterized protein n=1 Tax=Streptosporangium saharense TaxID=1706840 RepID=A0A7W7VQ32_9ACTN|nr:hypothetical protein [Streptosporangium saharense]MBB4917910.1 hypothetical protein [Streptosporangium saharense]
MPTDPNSLNDLVSPGLLGFLMVAALGLALYLLVKSMRRQISRIEVPSEAELRQQDRDGAKQVS